MTMKLKRLSRHTEDVLSHFLRASLLVVLALFVPSVGVFAQVADPVKATADEAFLAQRWDEAAKGYRELTQRNANDGRSWMRLGASLHNAGDFDGSVGAYQKSIEMGYSRMVSQFNIACAFARAGDDERGYAALEAAIDMGYHSTQQILQDTDLVSLRGTARWDGLIERTRRPTQSYAAANALRIEPGRWSVEGAFGSIGLMTVNATSREFVRHFELVHDGKRVFYVMLFFSVTENAWLAQGADKDGAVFSGKAEVSSSGASCRGRAVSPEGARDVSWRLNLGSDQSGTVVLTERTGGSWRQKAEYRLKREPGGR